MTAHCYPKGCFFRTLSDIRNSHITVMGLGLNGGGESSVRFFLKHGAYVTVTDMKNRDGLLPTIKSLESDPSLDKTRLTYVLGEHRVEDFSEADCVIKNPGIKYDGNKFLAAAKVIETDLSIFLHFTKSPIIAVTGSKGKSSTVSAIQYGLEKAGFTSFSGGNITVSPLSFLEKTNEKTIVVLELSSWQLADLRGRTVLRPHIAVITKIVPDHQNFYHSMEAYIADKKLIYADQTENDFTIIDADEDEPGSGPSNGSTWGTVFAAETKGMVLNYSRRPLPHGILGVWQETAADGSFHGVARLPRTMLSSAAQKNMDDTETILGPLAVPGDHMKTNVLNAALVLRLMKIAPEKIIRILGNWEGLPHRLQYFFSWTPDQQKNAGIKTRLCSVKFYNDSCATVPEAAAAASQAFGHPVILLCGGTEKGLSMAPLAASLSCHHHEMPVKSLYLLAGSATDELCTLLRKYKVSYNGPYPSLEDMLTAVKRKLSETASSSLLQTDETIVFSPGATSFGMFINEFDRGTKFMETVRQLFGTA